MVRSKCLLLLLLMLSSAVSAVIAPPVLLQRNRAARALDADQRAWAERLARALARTATPEELQAVIAAEVKADPPLAFVLYTAVAHAELREEIILGFKDRIHMVDSARGALDRYVLTCKDMLRPALPGPEGEPLPPPADAPPEFRQDDEVLFVFRPLPAPRAGMSRSRLRMLAEAAEADRAQLELYAARADQASDAYSEGNLAWSRWLGRLATQAESITEAKLRAEVRRGLPHPAPAE